MRSNDVLVARTLLKLSQTEFAKQLGWTTKRNVTNLESPNSDKTCSTQTALAIECLLRRKNLWEEFINHVTHE
jgi:transcriptional regulator with XRE-family HTH domain